MDEKHLKKYVFSSTVLGTEQRFEILGEGDTSDPSKLIDTLIKDPSKINIHYKYEVIQFCWIVTPDTLQRAKEKGVEMLFEELAFISVSSKV